MAMLQNFDRAYGYPIYTKIPIETIGDIEVREWLYEHIGLPGIDWVADSDCRLLTIWFKTSADAQMFTCK